MGDTEEITRTGENGGIVRAQGRKYSFADLNGTEFAKSTMENGCFYIFFTTSTEDVGQRARALWEYVTSFDKTFFLQTIHSS